MILKMTQSMIMVQMISRIAFVYAEGTPFGWYKYPKIPELFYVNSSQMAVNGSWGR